MDSYSPLQAPSAKVARIGSRQTPRPAKGTRVTHWRLPSVMKLFARLLLILSLVCSIGLDAAESVRDIGDARVHSAIEAPGAAEPIDHCGEGICDPGGTGAALTHVLHVIRTRQPADTPFSPASARAPELRPPIETPLA